MLCRHHAQGPWQAQCVITHKSYSPGHFIHVFRHCIQKPMTLQNTVFTLGDFNKLCSDNGMGLEGTVSRHQGRSITFSDLSSLIYHQPPPVCLVIGVFTPGLVPWTDSQIIIELKIARHLIVAESKVLGCLPPVATMKSQGDVPFHAVEIYDIVVQSWLSLNLRSSCISILSSGITSIYSCAHPL